MGHLMPKLDAPELSGAILRDHLETKLNLIPQKKLTLITAGAGYGKTTLAAQALAKNHLPCLWYRPEPGDANPKRFIFSLWHGVRKYCPEFKNLPENNKIEIKELGENFYRSLEDHLTSDIFLVLDDCREFCQNTEIKRFLQLLLDLFIPHFHLVLISRTLPELKFSRLMARRQVVHILESDLAFTRNEIRLLFGRLFDIALSEKYIEQLYERTGGWVSGLVLFYQSLRKKTGAEMREAISRLKGTHRYIADYLNENIFELQTRKQQDFLLKTSILSGLHVDFCNDFLDIDNARAILCDLEDRHCFIFSANEERNRFFYHDLFREFLKDRLESEYGLKETSRLYNRAAFLYEKGNKGPEALKNHILAGNMTDASRLLNRFARPIIKQDRPQMLKSLLSTIPEQYMDDEPWFQYLQAGYYGLCSQLQLAVNAYEKVLKNFRSNKDEHGECLCLMELAEHYLSAGELKKSEQAYKKILGKNQLDPYLTIIVMGHLIQVLALSRRTGEADKYARQAMAMLNRLDDENSLKMARAWIYVAQGYRYVFSGSYQEAMIMGEDAKPLFESAGEHRFLFSSYFLISYSCFYLGRFSKGMDAAEEGLLLTRGNGAFDEFSEFLRLLRAKNCLEIEGISQNQLKQVFRDCEKCLVSFEAVAFPGGVAQAYLVLHQACLKKGDIDGAEQNLRKGISAIRENDMPLIKNELHVALAKLLLFERRQKREAFILLKNAEQELLYSGWHISLISKIFARYYWKHGHKESAHKYMVYSLKINEEESFDAWLVADRKWVIPLLEDLYCMGSMRDYIEKLLKQMGPEAGTELAKLPGRKKSAEQRAMTELLKQIPKPSPPAIAATFFERFRLFVGNREVRADQWKSQKAKNLFKYLLAMRYKGYIEKEILMELIWPDEDPKLSNQRFHVAMASIRKTLEPNILKGIRSAYIRRSGQAYRVRIGEKGHVDIEAFSREIQTGEAAEEPKAAMTHYKKALSIAQGDFLEEDVYEEWCAKERSRYKQLCLNALKKIIQYRENQKDYSGCIAAATSYIESDPYAEGMVRKLMKYYAWIGNRPMISKIYRQFHSLIKTELGCGVSEETRVLHEKLSHSHNDEWNTATLQTFKIHGSL